MKKTTFTFILFLMLLSITACSNDDKDEIISTSDFVLDTPFEWNFPKDKDVFHIINSDTEMHQYTKKDDLTEIVPNTPDFNKYTILAGNTLIQKGISRIETKLIKHNHIDYTFEIYVFTNPMSSVAENRIISVTVPKLAGKAQVTKRVMIQLQ